MVWCIIKHRDIFTLIFTRTVDLILSRKMVGYYLKIGLNRSPPQRL